MAARRERQGHSPRRRIRAAVRRVPCAPLAAVLLACGGRGPDVIYLPSADDVVTRMLELARVDSGDVVYDLGCGDGRIVIAAARDRGARGVCVDIDIQRIAEAYRSGGER